MWPKICLSGAKMNMAMMGGRRIFVDTNILTRATVDLMPLHSEARAILAELWSEKAELIISHQVLREYISNTTRPQTYSPALPISEVLNQVKDFRRSFQIFPDSPAVLNQFLELVERIPVGGKQVHDTNIVATMLVNDVDELLTHNVKDFERYLTYIRVIPLTEETT